MDINTTAAMSMAEGHPRYAMDVSMVFGGKTERDRVLRTTFDQLGVWKTKYADVGISKYEPEKYVTFKEAATIINPATKKEEIWVFGIDSTKADDIVTAVEIATDKYKTPPGDFLRNIYIKNLNAEREHEIRHQGGLQALVNANKKLYTGVSDAIREAARKLRITGELNLWVVSSNVNEKIPKTDLHNALREGGAEAVGVAKKPFDMRSGANEGKGAAALIKGTNLHLAKFRV
ncbi:MAG TPA: hypothetical protein PK011_16965 [Marinagarivorans sp.]|nr:hypothetical protein [Marinagarivorans sp.]HNG59114.1 hypothetical protein [Cellvibrionaceae bacterium]